MCNKGNSKYFFVISFSHPVVVVVVAVCDDEQTGTGSSVEHMENEREQCNVVEHERSLLQLMSSQISEAHSLFTVHTKVEVSPRRVRNDSIMQQ